VKASSTLATIQKKAASHGSIAAYSRPAFPVPDAGAVS